jgi:hypothetical protein
MKIKNFVLTTIFIVMGILNTKAQTVSPAQSGGYIPGIMGVRDYANPGQDGLSIIDYNIFINANSYYDRDGNKANTIEGPLGNTIPFDIEISGYINSLMLVYASPKLSFLGNAQYLFIAAPNYTTAKATIGLGELLNGNTVEGGASGFGDLTIAPLMLSWSLDKFDFTCGYLFYTPTGRYKTGADDNIGLGYWSHIIQMASYYYPKPDKSTAFMFMPSYEFHGNIKDAKVRPGSRLIMEYGISQYLSEKVEVTLQAGHAWQTGEDSGSDVYWDTSVKDQMSVFGLGVSYWFLPNLYANAKYTGSFGLKQNFKTNMFQLQIMFVPNLLKK